MATYIALLDYTDQGARAIKDSPKRAEAFRGEASGHGIEVRDLYWTFGAHDGVLVLDAPDDKAVLALLLSLAQAGNVRTTTLRAYDSDEMREIVGRVGR